MKIKILVYFVFCDTITNVTSNKQKFIGSPIWSLKNLIEGFSYCVTTWDKIVWQKDMRRCERETKEKVLKRLPLWRNQFIRTSIPKLKSFTTQYLYWCQLNNDMSFRRGSQATMCAQFKRCLTQYRPNFLQW